MELKVGKKYVTQGNYIVEVIAIRKTHSPFYVVALTENESILLYTMDGKKDVDFSHTSPYDIVQELTPYNEFKKNDKVMVKDYQDTTWCKSYFSHTSPYDIVQEPTPYYNEFKKNDKVMVKDVDLSPVGEYYQDTTWYKSYFSHVGEDGSPYTFSFGNTSWSAGNHARFAKWDCCRRPTAEELEE